MAWIESHQSLPNHPKLLHLCALTGWEKDLAVGRLHLHWYWCLDYALDGNLTKFNDSQIALGMGVAMPDSKRSVAAMVEACWLDRQPYLRVHGWWDYVGRFLRTKWRHSPEKWQGVQKLYDPECSGHVIDTTTDRPNQPTKPNRPNLTDRPAVAGAGKGFPVTVDDALAQCSLVAVPREFVMHCYDRGASRGGRDAKDCEIRDFPAFVRISWKYEQDRIGRERASQTAGGRFGSGPRENPRNVGIVKGPTDYAAAAQRKAEGRGQAPMAGPLAETEGTPPATEGPGGRGL